MKDTRIIALLIKNAKVFPGILKQNRHPGKVRSAFGIPVVECFAKRSVSKPPM